MEKEKEAKSTNKNRLWIGVILFSLIIGVIIFTFVSCYMFSVNSTYVVLKNSKMTCSYDDFFGGWNVVITGMIKNESKIKFSYVSVYFSVYDQHGNKLGSIFDNITNLNVGETWSFKAENFACFDVPIKSYRLSEINCR